jgi:uncharacterized protein (TIGR02265 family)
MSRQVRGTLFLDYIRMVKSRGDVDWRPHLEPEDLAYLEQRIDLGAWYPMATFERLGLAILEVVAAGDLEAVRAWGRRSLESLARTQDGLLVENDPRESLMRFQVYRRTFFDFEAAAVTVLHDTEVRLRIAYGMSDRSEEAASYQTMGFFERLVELAGGRAVAARFAERSWQGAKVTTLVLNWNLLPQGGAAGRRRG